MTTAKIGSRALPLVSIAAGQAVSNAVLTPGLPVGGGEMSAGYGGSGELLTYSAEADFTFVSTAPEELYLALIDNNSSGAGFDNLQLEVKVDGTDHVYDFTTLSSAETFFTNTVRENCSVALVGGPGCGIHDLHGEGSGAVPVGCRRSCPLTGRG